jgi:hypothetical protein
VVPASSSDPIINADVNVWYGSPPSLPGVSGQPTKAAPTRYLMTPSNAGSYSFAVETFSGFVNGDQPLYYSASINSVMGQIDTGPVMVANTLPTVMISPTARYFTLQAAPDAIDWHSAGFQSVELIVTATIDGTVQAPVSNTWFKGDGTSRYLTWPMQVGNAVSYTWIANYITSGKTPQSMTGTGSAPVLDIPPSPAPAGMQPDRLAAA